MGGLGHGAQGGSSGASSSSSVGRRLGGTDTPCTGECQAIQDVEDGWEGFCLGLELLNHSTTPALCRSACCADPNCEVWQWGNAREDFGNALGSCFYGRGLECSSDRFDNFLVLAGQRISHGTVSETIKLELGIWCTGRGMRQAAGVAGLSATGTYKQNVDECQKVCFQDPACSIWEHSTAKGCWYGYSDECSVFAEGAQTMVAGERVARACGTGVRSREPTDYLTVFGIIGAVALLLTCCAALVLLLGGGGTGAGSGGVDDSSPHGDGLRSRSSELLLLHHEEEDEENEENRRGRMWPGGNNNCRGRAVPYGRENSGTSRGDSLESTDLLDDDSSCIRDGG